MKNNVSIKLRLKALFIDYLCILAYMAILFLFIMSIYTFVLNGIPVFTETQSQWIAFLTTILPITTYFIIKESKKPYASFGKIKAGLKIKYSGNSLKGSLIRNILKFLPWEFGHLSVIKGIYNGFDSIFVFVFYGLAVILPIIYILMVIFRKDHRHLPDLLSGSQIVRVTHNKKENIITSNNSESFGVMYMVLAALVGVGYGVISDDLTTGLVSGMVIGLAIDLLVYFKNNR